MSVLTSLVKRNSKLFFKDKGFFFSSLITPIILLFLYATFLANIFKETFIMGMPEGTSTSLINGMVGSQILSSLLAVSCVTVAVCSNMLIVQDKVTGARKDLIMAPVKKSVLALSYYIATLVSTLIICFIAFVVCLGYIAINGWYMSFTDILLIALDTFLLVMFGTALSSIINFFLTTQGQISAVSTIISCGYGFICGAYMPMAQFSEGLRNVLAFLPGTYGTVLLRNHAMNGALSEIQSMGLPDEAITAIRDSVDCNLYCFGSQVNPGIMYLVLILTIVILITIYILLNVFVKRKAK